jgi:hypothetical protein
MSQPTLDQIKAHLQKGRVSQLSTEEAICWISYRMLDGEVYMSGLVQSPPPGYQVSETICITALRWLESRNAVRVGSFNPRTKGRPRRVYAARDLKLIQQLADLWEEFLCKGRERTSA